MPNQTHTDGGWAVVTGASSGLGALFAEQLAQRGLPLVLAGRDRPRLEAVRRRVLDLTEVDVELVVGDLAQPSGVDALLAHLDGRPVEVLVNNAGFGTYGPFADADATREHGMIGVNVDALVGLTHALLPGMLARGSGGILNVASVIAFQPAPYQAGYGATKAFVLSFSQALWAETRGSGVTVTALCPGPTDTGFVGALDADVSHVGIYRHLAAPGPVVSAGLRGLDRGRAVVVTGWRNKAMAASGRVTPGWISALISARILRPARTSKPTVGTAVR